jgi:branched-chain amino acid transport system permease protein
MDWGAIFTLAVKELISPIAVTYILCAIGLSVHFGYTGLLNFGQAAFAAIGGYGLAIGILTFHLPLPLAAIFSLICSALFAVVLGIPTLRLLGNCDDCSSGNLPLLYDHNRFCQSHRRIEWFVSVRR